MAFLEVDVVGAYPAERVVDLLEDLLPREPLVLTAVVHREEELRRKHVRVAGAAFVRPAEKGLGAAAAVDVRRVEEVDADLEGLVDAGPRGCVVDAEAVGQPGAERDLRDLEVAGAELAEAHPQFVPEAVRVAENRLPTLQRVSTTEYETVPAVAGEATARAGTVVMKFGGTSVADPQKLKDVAARIVAAHAEGTRVVAVLSAMGDTTDELVRLAYEISPRPEPRELDMLISVGERISCALAAMAIHDLGDEAISLTGSQAGIVTDTVHGKAKIVDVRARRIHEALDQNKVVLVAGFQGVSTSLDITTLGRGGSDTTAVALAAALAASHCEINTDVAGVFSADPRIVPDARKLHAVSYDEMLELSASGAKVLQLRSVEYGRRYGVRIHVRSSFVDEPGTWVTEEDVRMEQAMISGVAADPHEAK